MDSPERTQFTSSSPIQDSPLYSFLSTLSPIISVKSRHAAQAFTEYNFPSPVFTSPRINQQRGTGFLKGSQCALLSKGKQSVGEEDSRVADCSLGSEQSITKSIGGGRTSCSSKDCYKDSEKIIPHSSPDSVGEYLADTVALGKDVAHSTTFTDLLVNQPHDVSHGCISSKENSVNLANDPEAEDTETEAIASHTLLETAEEDLLVTEPVSGEQCQPHLVSDVVDEQLAIVSNQMEQTFVEVDADGPACSVSHHGLQNAEASQHNALECTRQLPCNSLQMTQAHNDCDEIRGVTYDGSVESSILYDSEEGNQQQRDTLRRCLQFEAAQSQGNTFCNSRSSWNAPNVLNSRSPASSTDLEISDSSHLKSGSASSSNQPVNLSRHITSRFTITTVTTLETHEVGRSTQNSVISSAKIPIPSGIGLHLNSIVNTSASSKFIAKDCSSSHSGKALSTTEQDMLDNSASLLLPITTEKFSDTLDNNQQGNLATDRESSATFQSSHKMNLMNEILNFEEENEHHMSPCDSRTASENSIRLEEFSEPPTKKRRKKTPNSIDSSEGCRRCSCKRSKCLKLYCECFAAGVYCSEPCSCVGCFNKPEYEETVLATRRQIESRNPLAFAPKILGTFKEIGNQVTPASGRHKRGCNCKKSKCLKKYCECYQAGVGCSDGCRCEGCQNAFGVKEGYTESRELLYKKIDAEKWEDSAGDKLEIANRNDLLQLEQPNPDNLSPVTPMFQSSNHGKDMAQIRIYDPSPEPEWQLKTDTGTSDVITCDLESECSIAGRVDPILQRHDELTDLCDLTPLPNIPSSRDKKVSSSSSNIAGSAKASQGRFNLGSVSLSSLAPHRWRGSPVTPLPRLGVNKFLQEPDSDNSMLCQIQEDDTPEILKDTRTPIKAVKASSPNQKRVSPPQNKSPEPRLTCSPSLKIGRKFVLQSISAFPPLTPYSDPKGGRIDK